MNEKQIVVGLVVGLLPYRIVYKSIHSGFCILCLQALFWTLMVITFHDDHQWFLHIPFIERIQNIITVIVTLLRDKPTN